MTEEEKQIVENYKSDLALYKYERKIGLGGETKWLRIEMKRNMSLKEN